MASNNTLLDEALDFISSSAIQGVFWGMNLSLYFLCTQLACQQYRKTSAERSRILFTFFCNSVMVLMAALELGGNTRIMQLAYINHGGVNNEPEAFINTLGTGTTLVVSVPSVVIPTLNSLIQLWRVWIIWEMSPYKFVVAILLSFVLFTADGTLIVMISTSIEPKLVRILEVVNVTAGLVFNLLVTMLLVGRIIVLRRHYHRLMGTTSESARQYTNIVSMLIESYALDSVWTMAAMIAFALVLEGNPVYVFHIFNDTGDQITVTAFLLVSYRVLLKQAWTPETGRQLSTLQWNHDEEATTSTG